ncbi:MAG: hypothetical protein U0Z44_04700 [Kouleothrix sp.]
MPGGVRAPLSSAGHAHIRERLPEARTIALDALGRSSGCSSSTVKRPISSVTLPSLFMGLVAPDGAWEHYDGHIRFVDSAGNIIDDRLDPARYREYRRGGRAYGHTCSHSTGRMGYPTAATASGCWQLNILLAIGTPLADAELREFRDHGHGTVTSSFFFHYARLIEILAAIERIELLLDDPDLAPGQALLRADAGVNYSWAPWRARPRAAHPFTTIRSIARA